MSREWANRIVFVLTCVGAFIALVIGVAHWTGVQLPCGGAQSGCDILGDPQHSRWFDVPIAFWGLGLYLFVALACVARGAIGVDNSPRLGSAIWVLLASGTVISISLIAYAKSSLDATCLWCLSSAITMTLAFLVHSAGLMRQGAEMRRGMPFGAYLATLVLFLTAGGGYGYMLSQKAKHVVVKTPVVDGIVPIYLPTSHIIGNPNAKVTIVAFSDLYCPLCRRMHKWVEQQIRGPYKDKVRLIVRHWPITEKHPHALSAAMLSEWAAEQGKYEPFLRAAQAIEDEHDVNLLLAAVKAAGLDVIVAEKLLNDPSARSRYMEQVAQDIGAGNRLGVESTPWWFIEYPDKTVEPTSGLGIQGKMESEAFRKRLQ